MKCPQDGTTLLMTDRSGVEIDYCPTCRGVWLDRGELDKIIERAGASGPAVALSEPARAAVDSYAPQGNRPPERSSDRASDRPADYRRDEDHRRRDDDDDYRRRPKRRESFLSELFDFD